MNDQIQIEFSGTLHALYMIRVEGDDANISQLRQGINSFYLSETPVTQALWEHVFGKNPSRFKGQNRPVERVSWFDSVIFCNKLSEMTGKNVCYYHDEAYTQPFGEKNGKYELLEDLDDKSAIFCKKEANCYRLPLEKEWEYAAKGGNKSKGYEYAGGNDLDDVGWYYENSHSETKPVKLKLPNELGLYDMSGNVWEWCWDLYHKDRSTRVYRGGSWPYYPENCRSLFRDSAWSANRSNNLGFRLALSDTLLFM